MADVKVNLGNGLRFNVSKYNRMAAASPEPPDQAICTAAVTVPFDEGGKVATKSAAPEKDAGPRSVESRAAIDKGFNALLARAHKGDKSVLPVLRDGLDSCRELVPLLSSSCLDVEGSLIRATFGQDLVAQQSIPRALEDMRRDLAGPTPSPLEKLLVERIVMCWLQVQHADMMYSYHFGTLSLEQGDYFQRRQDRAHRRYLQAIKTLAEVRRLLVPTVQVNIGEQQVNVAK